MEDQLELEQKRKIRLEQERGSELNVLEKEFQAKKKALMIKQAQLDEIEQRHLKSLEEPAEPKANKNEPPMRTDCDLLEEIHQMVAGMYIRAVGD